MSNEAVARVDAMAAAQRAEGDALAAVREIVRRWNDQDLRDPSDAWMRLVEVEGVLQTGALPNDGKDGNG